MDGLPSNYAESQAEARADIRLEARDHLKKAWDSIYSMTNNHEATFEELYDELTELELRNRPDYQPVRG